MNFITCLVALACCIGQILVAAKQKDRNMLRGQICLAGAFLCLFLGKLFTITGVRLNPIFHIDAVLAVACILLTVLASIMVQLAKRAKKLQPAAVEDGTIWPPAPKTKSSGG